MKRKIICYDLHGGNPEDYSSVYEFIEFSLKGVRATESVYIGFSDISNSELRDKLSNMFGENITVLVNDFPVGASWYNLKDSEKWKI